MSTKDVTLEIAPAEIADGRWIVKSAHLTGWNHVCYDEQSAKVAAKFAEACIKAARAKDAELIQRLVDALEGLVYLEFCNEEGLSSGAPSSKDWKRAFDKAQEQIDAAKAAGFTPSE